jgi:hypothetical protein
LREGEDAHDEQNQRGPNHDNALVQRKAHQLLHEATRAGLPATLSRRVRTSSSLVILKLLRRRSITGKYADAYHETENVSSTIQPDCEVSMNSKTICYLPTLGYGLRAEAQQLQELLAEVSLEKRLLTKA